MKGIIFTEFLEMVEEQFGMEIADNIIEHSELQSGGIYTSIGTYDFNEMVALISELHKEVGIPVNDLLYTFGKYLFDGLGTAHPEVIANYSNPIGLLYSIEDHIHVHVKKLYPDAELPTFHILEKSERHLSMIYSSSRGLYALAQGLIEKTFEHFDTTSQVTYELLEKDGTRVKFDIVQDGE